MGGCEYVIASVCSRTIDIVETSTIELPVAVEYK